MKIFISYSRKDLPFVEKLNQDLTDEGHDVWYDLTDLQGGDRWATQIEKAILESDAFIIVVSPNSIASEWVEKEFLFAHNKKAKIIPLMYKDCQLPLWLLNIQCIDVQGGNYEENYPHILKALTGKVEEQVEGMHPKGLPVWARVIAIICFVGIVITIAFVIDRSPSTSTVPTSSVTATTPQTVSITETDTPPPSELPTDTPASSVTATETFTPVPFTPTPLPVEITDATGVSMRLIPAGEFTMGSDKGFTDEQPLHMVYLDAFYMDKYEVTFASYQDCVDAYVCSSPRDPDYLQRVDYYTDPVNENHPIVFVDWYMAQTYCEWRGARLPTEAEWEKAARGVDNRTYPWGEDVNCDRVNYVVCGRDVTDVGIHTSGSSLYGVNDLAGNVWEWVADWYGADYYATLETGVLNPQGPSSGQSRVLRGGSFKTNISNLRVADRYFLVPTTTREEIGFRCARDVAP